ncbi:MAG: hypothetical protein AYK18_04820 [Theionarchaea archaeon DG-70]|nr:MAG: hypothetical protein AYK18_04820 [Theionarchaea archaeon DG-70]
MSGNQVDLSAQERELLSQVGELLASRRTHLVSELQKVFKGTESFHEHLYTPQQLLQFSEQSTEELIQGLQQQTMYCAPQEVREQGMQFVSRGLGDRSLVDTLSAWQNLCLPLVVSAGQFQDTEQQIQTLVVTARALSCYASLVTEGYLQANRDHILEAQNEMIIALEQSLRESEQWLATTLKSIGDGVIATNTKGLITFLNPVAETLTGWDQNEAVGMPLAEVFHIINEETRERCRNPFEKIIEFGKIVGLANSTVLVARDGTEKLIADSGAPIRDEEDNILGTVLVFRDVTEKRKMEDDILKLKTEKMESISILAGGIAHDFNNILTAILGNVNLAKVYVTEKKAIDNLTKVEKASLQAKDLTQQLLTFSRGGAPIRKTTSVAEIIKESTIFALRGSNVGYTFSIAEDLCPVDIDEGQISQVISNLIINADQAMPEGGIVQVQAENVVVTTSDDVPLPPGRYVKISVQDQGIGIPEKYLPKVFDPYFTTKQRGSGLGLATSYSIIKSHEGYIDVTSEWGVGTTFYVYLPASKRELTSKKEEPEEMVKGKGRILLMDDEESILEATGEVLTYLGYDVEVAGDGEEAIAQYKKARHECQPFDAVIIDLTIRGKMGGRETIEALLKIDPEVKAIVSSGYSDDPVMANYRKYGFRGVVTKPYTLRELSETLHAVMEGNGQDTGTASS